jgi:hypothetical protein
MLGACAAWQRLDGLLREAEELDGEFEDVAQTSALVELELEALRYVVCSVAYAEQVWRAGMALVNGRMVLRLAAVCCRG